MSTLVHRSLDGLAPFIGLRTRESAGSIAFGIRRCARERIEARAMVSVTLQEGRGQTGLRKIPFSRTPRAGEPVPSSAGQIERGHVMDSGSAETVAVIVASTLDGEPSNG